MLFRHAVVHAAKGAAQLHLQGPVCDRNAAAMLALFAYGLSGAALVLQPSQQPNWCNRTCSRLRRDRCLSTPSFHCIDTKRQSSSAGTRRLTPSALGLDIPGLRRRGSMTVSAALPDARATAASDAHPDILTVVYDEQQIADAVVSLGRQLAVDYAHKQPLLLGALTGAFTFTADLARAMAPVPQGLAVDFFTASSYGATTVSTGDVAVNMAAGKIDVAGRHVIVVEDIIDTGATLRRVVDRLQEAGAASVKVAVLLDKAAQRKVAIQPDYCALSCPDEFVVGYGLDFNEAYRSLPYVGVLKPELYT